MAVTTAILLQLILVSLVSASHYQAGHITFMPKGRDSDGTFMVEIRNKETYHFCSTGPRWTCFSADCGNEITSQNGKIDCGEDEMSVENKWCETEIVSTRVLSSDKVFLLGKTVCCWTANRHPDGTVHHGDSWRLQATIDLGKRSDTEQPNRPPVTAAVPFLRVPENCPRAYNLLSFDPDGDRVVYRYGVSTLAECYNCHQFDGFYLDQASGTLHYYNATASDAIYGFELVVRDFPRQIITLSYVDGTQTVKHPLSTSVSGSPAISKATASWSSLSSLPLQFSVLVEPPPPSCEEGLYLPKFIAPTPADGTHFHTEVNTELEIKIMAEVTYGKLDDIYITGPLNVTKHKTINDEFFIRWTPTEKDIDSYFPICFVVQSNYSHNTTKPHSHGSAIRPPPSSPPRVFQSEMRCVVVHVGLDYVQTDVSCEGNQMTLTFEKSPTCHSRNISLMFRDPSDDYCALHIYQNDSHVTAVIPLYSCGTYLEEAENYLIFKNELVAADCMGRSLTKKHLMELNFYCEYPRNGSAQESFGIRRNNVTVWDKGFGTLTYNFEFFPNDHFTRMIDPVFYPLEYGPGDRIYMGIDGSFGSHYMELFVDTCKATPYDNQYHGPSYTLIKDGCAVDSTVIIYPKISSSGRFTFSMEVIDFIGMYEQVYISCSVIVCDSRNPYTRCAQGCSSVTSARRKRDVSVESATYQVSQGPLRLKRSAKSTVTTLNLNTVLIAGSILVAAGIISFKMSRSKWQRLRTVQASVCAEN